MILPEISAYIVAGATATFVAGPSTSTKTQIWLNRFPSDGGDTAVALYESGGVGPTYTYTGLDYERPTVQIISRSTSYATARSNAQTIFNRLAAVENATLSSVNYITITPIQSPFDIGADAGGRSMVSCNYQVEKAVSA